LYSAHLNFSEVLIYFFSYRSTVVRETALFLIEKVSWRGGRPHYWNVVNESWKFWWKSSEIFLFQQTFGKIPFFDLILMRLPASVSISFLIWRKFSFFSFLFDPLPFREQAAATLLAIKSSQQLVSALLPIKRLLGFSQVKEKNWNSTFSFFGHFNFFGRLQCFVVNLFLPFSPTKCQ